MDIIYVNVCVCISTIWTTDINTGNGAWYRNNDMLILENLGYDVAGHSV